jgi:hypothetical protein
MKAILTHITFVAVAVLASSAIAEDRLQAHDLYANRDGKAFSFERSFPSLAACDAAAKSLYESKRVLGAGCKSSTSAPAGVGPNSPGEFGPRFLGARPIESKPEQQKKTAQDVKDRGQENRGSQDRLQSHDLYTNRDGKAFSFERSFPSLAACDAAAKSLYESKRVLGAGCKSSTPAPAGVGPNSPGESGPRFVGARPIESKPEQQKKTAQDVKGRAQERRDAASLD